MARRPALPKPKPYRPPPAPPKGPVRGGSSGSTYRKPAPKRRPGAF